MIQSITFSHPTVPLGRQLAETCMVQRYLIEAITLQLLEPQLNENAEAQGLVLRAQDVLRHNAAELAAQLEGIPASRHELEEASVRLAGMFVGSMCKRRTREVPAMLRDDYALLNLVEMNYTMLHTDGIALRETSVASLALNHLRQLAAISRDIARLMPSLVIHELGGKVEGLSREAEQTACSNTQAAWRNAESAA